WIFSLTTRLATTGPCLGSQPSSITTASSLLPSTPPPALMVSIAVSTPSLTMSPYCVNAPVKGPAMAMRMVSACATEESIMPAARPSAAAIGVKRTFIRPPVKDLEKNTRNPRIAVIAPYGGFPDIVLRTAMIQCADMRSGQQAAQHPGILFVHVQALREQVGRGLVVDGVGALEGLARRAGDRLVGIDQHAQHFFGRRHGRGFGDGAEARVFRIGAGRIMPQGADALGDGVQRLPGFRVLGHEQLVQG